MLVHTEDAHPLQVGGVVVDQLAAGIDGDLVDQFPTDTQGLGGRRHAHPINRQALQDPAGDPVGQLRTIIGAGQGGLEDLPAAGWIAAGEPRDTDMKAGGEPHDGKVDQGPDDVVP